jgi:quercetin dioxygenase-like cupin family protein
MSSPFQYFADLASEIAAIPADSIVSRTLHNAANLKIVLFGFAAGQELSEHTATRPALLHFLRGEAVVTLGGETLAAKAGTFVAMPARLPHSVSAKTEVVMLLLMLAPERAGNDDARL